MGCKCPSHVALKDLSTPPKHWTPIDKLGFPQRCCGCCSLRVASVFICLVSFAWGAVELQSADKFMSRVFPARGDVFLFCKPAYLSACVLFLLACGVFLLGIIIQEECPIHVYICCAFIFNCLGAAASVGGAVATAAHAGGLAHRPAVRLAFGLIWSFTFFYLLMVVNSYKLAVWLNCECPPNIAYSDLCVKPKHRTPIDKLGFPQRCCGCCSLRVASVFICLVSLLWGAIEIALADRFMSRVFPARGDVCRFSKLVYLVICVVFVLVSVGLMIGIIMKKEHPIVAYVWYAFIFNLLSILASVGSTVAVITHTGGLGARHILRLTLAIMWSAMFFYFLMVVNSYKLAVWYRSLGFGV